MSTNAKVKTVSQRELQRELAKPRRAAGRRGLWKDTIALVKKDGKPRRVSDISRGSINAGGRAAKDAGLSYLANYESNEKGEFIGYIIIYKPEEPAEEPAEEAVEEEEVTEPAQE